MKLAARSVTALHEFTRAFDEQTRSTYYNSTQSDKDVEHVSVLLRNQILEKWAHIFLI